MIGSRWIQLSFTHQLPVQQPPFLCQQWDIYIVSAYQLVQVQNNSSDVVKDPGSENPHQENSTLGSWTYHQSKMATKQFETVAAQGIITTRARLGLSWPLASRSFRMSAVVTSETLTVVVNTLCNLESWQYQCKTECAIALERIGKNMFEEHLTSQQNKHKDIHRVAIKLPKTQ